MSTAAAGIRVARAEVWLQPVPAVAAMSVNERQEASFHSYEKASVCQSAAGLPVSGRPWLGHQHHRIRATVTGCIADLNCRQLADDDHWEERLPVTPQSARASFSQRTTALCGAPWASPRARSRAELYATGDQQTWMGHATGAECGHSPVA